VTAYVPPDQETLRTSVSRDLHDVDNKAFATSEVNDMINQGIAEANLLMPKEYRDTVALVDSVFEYPLTPTVTDIFRVEVWRNNQNDVLSFYAHLPPKDEDSISGWEWYGGSLMIPTTTDIDTDSNDSLVVWGYQDRDPLLDDAEVLDGNLTAEYVVRAYCAFTAFQRLIASRSLFQQWQTQANNSDVSATQLLGMASVYSREWRELRMRVRRLRRST
jgi:hypothetical protein